MSTAPLEKKQSSFKKLKKAGSLCSMRTTLPSASPLVSISAQYDITNDILVDVHLNPYRYSIVIFDRGYPLEDLFRFLQHKGVFF